MCSAGKKLRELSGHRLLLLDEDTEDGCTYIGKIKMSFYHLQKQKLIDLFHISLQCLIDLQKAGLLKDFFLITFILH